MQKSLRVLFIAMAMLTSGAASACQEGFYEVCTIFCFCVPNSGTVGNGVAAAANPLPDLLNVVGGVVHGNVAELSKGVGGLVIKASCPGCAAAGQILLDKPDKQFIEGVVGRGWLLFMGGFDPVLIVADAATSAATYIALKKEQSPIPVAAPPAVRGQKIWEASPSACIVASEVGAIVVGWVDAPVLKDTKTGTQSTFPSIDLQEGDLVSVTSDDSCPAVPAGQTKYKSAKMRYSWSKTLAGAPMNMHTFFQGQLLSDIYAKTQWNAMLVKKLPSRQLPSLAGASKNKSAVIK